jgi:site-specific recombinase XerD
VHCVGKGRKERRTPLVPNTRKVLKAWLKESNGALRAPLFPTTTGKHLSRDAIERRLARHVAVAAESCPSIKTKHVTTHTLRHTAAMRLLLAGNDVTVIALWLGHEQISTTNIYLHADMTHKQQAIDRTKPPNAKPGRYQPPTRSYASSRTCEYADTFPPQGRPGQRDLTKVGLTVVSA